MNIVKTFFLGLALVLSAGAALAQVDAKGAGNLFVTSNLNANAGTYTNNLNVLGRTGIGQTADPVWGLILGSQMITNATGNVITLSNGVITIGTNGMVKLTQTGSNAFLITVGTGAAQFTISTNNIQLGTNTSIAGSLSVSGGITNSSLTASRAVVSDANDKEVSSAVTANELANLTGTVASLAPVTTFPTVGAGQVATYDGTNISYGNQWKWIIDEDFIGDAGTGGRMGRESWVTSNNAGGVQNTPPGQLNVPGMLELMTTNVADRSAIVCNGNGNAMICSNMAMYFVCRVKLCSTNTANDKAGFRIGLINTGTGDGASGIFLRYTNFIWELVTADGSAYTTNSSGVLVNGTNEWKVLAFKYDGLTNVVAYIGPTENALTPFATNTTKISSGTCSPVISMNKYLGATLRWTNQVDYYRLAAKLY